MVVLGQFGPLTKLKRNVESVFVVVWSAFKFPFFFVVCFWSTFPA